MPSLLEDCDDKDDDELPSSPPAALLVELPLLSSPPCCTVTISIGKSLRSGVPLSSAEQDTLSAFAEPVNVQSFVVPLVSVKPNGGPGDGLEYSQSAVLELKFTLTRPSVGESVHCTRTICGWPVICSVLVLTETAECVP